MVNNIYWEVDLREILVVCNDAGGAEVISSWVRKHGSNYLFTYLLEGPAVAIFKRKMQGIEIIARETAFKNFSFYDFVLAGTGWASDLEKMAIKLAVECNISSAAYLDHWMEYRQRFELQGELFLPNEIWVGDIYAQHLVSEEFPLITVKLVPNLYLEEIAAEIIHLNRPHLNPVISILYVSEPTSVVAKKKYGDAHYYGYSEFEALENYLEYIGAQKMREVRIRIRPHPSEPPHKYYEIIAKFRLTCDIEESNGTTLIDDCAWADWVVGCQSMAMVIGVLAHKEVYSCIPNQGNDLILPYPEIKKLFQL